MVSGLTFVTLLLVVYGLRDRRSALQAVALAGVPAAGVAIALDGIGFPVIYAVALPILAVDLARRLISPPAARGRRALPPGTAVFLVFFLWCLVITLVAPFLFNGQLVVSPTGGSLVGGTVTKSNLAQLLYLLAGIWLMVFVARSPEARPQLLGITTGVVTLLSLWRYLATLSGLPFPEGLFDNSPTFIFIDTAPGGAERFRGILSEPSSLGGACLVALAYMVPRSFEVRGLRRAGVLAVAAAALFLGILSTSTTFVIAGLISTGLISASLLLGFIRRRYSLKGALGLLLASGVVALVWWLPTLVSTVQELITEKTGSSSFEERSSGNGQAYELFLDTWGLGAGLGSSRASSFVPSMMGGVGFPGVLLLALGVLVLLRYAPSTPEYRPVRWVLLVGFVTKAVAGPDLADITGAFWISFGLLAGAAYHHRATSAHVVSGTGSTGHEQSGTIAARRTAL